MQLNPHINFKTTYVLQNKTDNVTEAEAVVMVVMMVTVMVLCFALMLMFC